MSHILAAVDFSEVTEPVIEQAVELARCLNAELTLLHVAAPEPDFVGYDVGPQSVRDSRARELRHEHRGLQARAEALTESGLPTTALLVAGSTVDTILHEADRFDSRLIVIGSHGHGAVYQALVGSVSAGVVKASRRPVLIIPAQSSAPPSSRKP